MKTTFQRGSALSLVLALFLCACAAQPQSHARPDKSESSSAEAAFPTVTDKLKPEKPPEEPAASEPPPEESAVPAPPPAEQDAPPVQVEFSEEAEQSLAWLRDRIDFPETMFGVAFLGCVGEASNGDWLSEANQAMLGQYPFISEIDAAHTIESDDLYLYCLVPVDENATVSINLVRWPPESDSEEIREVRYRSESGEPVLFFADCGDDAAAYDSYIQVQIVDSDGNSCVWYPQLDAMGHIIPCLSESGDYNSFDFTEYSWLNTSEDLGMWLGTGWSGPMASQLAGTKEVSLRGICWTRQATEEETGRSGTVSLWFFPDDEMGGPAELDWMYNGSDYYDKIWIGSWTIKTVLDGPSYLILTLCEDGKNNGVYITETYPILISPSGMELVIGEGMNGIKLPFLPEEDTGAYILTMLA